MEQTASFPPQINGLPPFAGPFDAHRLAADGCDVLFATYPAGTSIGVHRHDTDNVGVITAGELTLLVDGEERTFGPGDWYHVPPNQDHAARFAVDTAEIEFWFEPGRSEGAAGS